MSVKKRCFIYCNDCHCKNPWKIVDADSEEALNHKLRRTGDCSWFLDKKCDDKDTCKCGKECKCRQTYQENKYVHDDKSQEFNYDKKYGHDNNDYNDYNDYDYFDEDNDRAPIDVDNDKIYQHKYEKKPKHHGCQKKPKHDDCLKKCKHDYHDYDNKYDDYDKKYKHESDDYNIDCLVYYKNKNKYDKDGEKNIGHKQYSCECNGKKY